MIKEALEMKLTEVSTSAGSHETADSLHDLLVSPIELEIVLDDAKGETSL